MHEHTNKFEKNNYKLNKQIFKKSLVQNDIWICINSYKLYEYKLLALK